MNKMKKMEVPWDDGGYSLSQMVGLKYIPPEYQTTSPPDVQKRSATNDGDEDEKPFTSPVEEHRLIRQQVWRSEGFDIDFTKLRCGFSFKPVDLDGDDFTDEPEKDGDLLELLSLLAVDTYNEEKGTNLKFERVVKANWHISAAVTFYITFDVYDPFEDKVKPYQAMVRDLNEKDREVYFCRPRPNIEDKAE